MKDRNISTLDFLIALQREFICLEIRSKIYISRGDKEYFAGIMSKKRGAILALSNKNNLPNIIEDEDENLRVWKEVVPTFGLPKFIYNITNATQAQLSFPYSGTSVRCGTNFGMSNKVNFQNDTVEIILIGQTEPTPFPRKEVKRLSPKETDEFFYYYPRNDFNTRTNGIGRLENYNFETKVAAISFKDKNSLILHRDDISRIL